MAEHFTVDDTWNRWIVGFTALPELLKAQLLADWQPAVEGFYDTSQDVVHIQTGALRNSGEWWLYVNDDGEVEAGLGYGDEVVDYASFEHDRGGDHAFLDIAWERSERDFTEAFGGVFQATIDHWS